MHDHINLLPRQTTQNLITTFGFTKQLREHSRARAVPVGIEIEVPWRAYFPDLWVDGFPNVEPDLLARISKECSEREKILLPRLMRSAECGVKSGADKYWEFAFDPVTDVAIVCDQVSVLQNADLIPPGSHSLHITFGGLHLTRNAHYIAMVLEGMSCSPARIMAGFHPTHIGTSVGWARKGYAGTFEKAGEHDLMHGYSVGSEFRLLMLPETSDELFDLLTVGQMLACYAADEQNGIFSAGWHAILAQCKHILEKHNLPDKNWGKPHMNPEIWRSFADQYWSIRADLQRHIIKPLLKYA